MNEKTISEMAEQFKENWENLTNKETKDAVIKNSANFWQSPLNHRHCSFRSNVGNKAG
jgi:hypothetical protein